MKIFRTIKDKLTSFVETILVIIFIWAIVFSGLGEMFEPRKAAIYSVIVVILLLIAVSIYKETHNK